MAEFGTPARKRAARSGEPSRRSPKHRVLTPPQYIPTAPLYSRDCRRREQGMCIFAFTWSVQMPMTFLWQLLA